MTPGAHLEAVFFDLDGTLIDTAPDMGGALNQLLNAHAQPTLAMATIRPHVSAGANALLKLGFKEAINPTKLPVLREQYLNIYREHLTNESCLFAGMSETLNAIEEKKLLWGVITNKPAWLTEPLLEQLGLRQHCSCVVSADTCSERKPHPMPMYHACRLANVMPQNCLYVGDALRDIQAGNAAGMTTLIAHYGYIATGEQTSDWQANGGIKSPTELLDWL